MRYPLLGILFCLASSVSLADDSYSALISNNLQNLNLHSLPLTGRITTTTPQKNYIYVCSTAPFQSGQLGGAMHFGSWIHTDNTFDLIAKPTVTGNVMWKNHDFSITFEDGQRRIYSNNLPNVPTGIYPIQPNTPAYFFDRNPNTIQEQNFVMAIPQNPNYSPSITCLPPGGPIGVLLTGGELFNALDGEGRNAVAYEIQDKCWGHPEHNGAYHYHSLTPCMDLGNKSTPPKLLGYAKDGFGIYGPYQDGKYLTNNDLDACHGLVSKVTWDGQEKVMYHYVANFEYPYTLGCYHGFIQNSPPPPPRTGPQG